MGGNQDVFVRIFCPRGRQGGTRQSMKVTSPWEEIGSVPESKIRFGQSRNELKHHRRLSRNLVLADAGDERRQKSSRSGKICRMRNKPMDDGKSLTSRQHCGTNERLADGCFGLIPPRRSSAYNRVGIPRCRAQQLRLGLALLSPRR